MEHDRMAFPEASRTLPSASDWRSLTKAARARSDTQTRR